MEKIFFDENFNSFESYLLIGGFSIFMENYLHPTSVAKK